MGTIMDILYLTEIQAAKAINFSASTLRKLRCIGGGPRFLKVGGKILYRQEDLIAWVEESGSWRSNTEREQATEAVR